VVRWQGVCFEKDAAADASKVKQPGKPTKDAPSKVTYRKGSVAEKYGPLFEGMPAKSHHKDPSQSEVIVYIITTISACGDECDSVKALRIFDLLRNPRYRIIKFIDDQWQGSKFEQGGAS
jgi:hypothetical protein